MAQQWPSTKIGCYTEPVSVLTLVRAYQMQEPPWLEVARREVGVHACPPGASNPRITEYHAGTNIAGYDDKASWCSSFVNWCLLQSGVAGTNSALARSWLEWGQSLTEPIPGCIAVLWRESPDSWKGHVGYYLRHTAEEVFLLGGNQLEAVREHSYPTQCVLSYRWPIGWPVPQQT
jgi:uncharacterized protein (TIGR02594 family)